MPALHSVLFYFTLEVTFGYSMSLIRDPARGTSQLYLRVAWTSAFKQFFLHFKYRTIGLLSLYSYLQINYFKALFRGYTVINHASEQAHHSWDMIDSYNLFSISKLNEISIPSLILPTLTTHFNSPYLSRSVLRLLVKSPESHLAGSFVARNAESCRLKF